MKIKYMEFDLVRGCLLSILGYDSYLFGRYHSTLYCLGGEVAVFKFED